MKPELQDQEVLAMYDVRGIQSYIFKSNAAKEIVGASALVEKIITEGLQAYIRTLGPQEREGYMTDWKNDAPEAFLKDPTIEMQIMFIGGGNAYVLFRKGSVCSKVNRFLAKYILEKTYSLNLAVAVVARTDSYKHDYEAINEEMRNIKACMPLNMPVGAMPFMEADSITGYPVVSHEKEGNFSTEAKLKRGAFPEQEDEKIFDNMVTEKGDSSTLAVFHIDGNSMGNSIRMKMEEKENYEDAVRTMRELSLNISGTFRQTVDKMRAYMDSLSPKVKNTDKKLYREIIVAGDDITFVCNAKLALPAVEYFLKHIGDSGEFSACGGIAFFNSHFPFSDAYQVAEACCDSAKKRAKRKENKVTVISERKSGTETKKETVSRIGNFLDYQICTNISAARLDSYRDRHYQNDGKLCIARPYYVPGPNDQEMNEKNDRYNIGQLHMWQKYFKEMPRSKAKGLRNVIPMGENEIKKEISFLKSRGYSEFGDSVEQYGIWYDALEIMDWLIPDEEEMTDENTDKVAE